jgi:mannose-1-phosphate guanylyltransferase
VGCFVLRLLEELKAFHPEVRKKKLVWESNTNGILDLALSMDIPSISIDYAVMERSKKNKVVSSQFDWSDLVLLNRFIFYWLALVIQLMKTGNMVIELIIIRLL